jgi:magnesium chelatase family protein
MRDRVDMHVPVGALALSALAAGGEGERSAHIRERVESARARQHARYAQSGEIAVNAHVSARALQVLGELGAEARVLLTSASERLGLTARGYHRVLRVARTIADLDESRSVEAPHVAEALRYRTTGEGPANSRE